VRFATTMACGRPIDTSGFSSLDTLRAPAELHTAAADGSTLTPITRINAERVALVRLGDYEPFTFKGWNDETVQHTLSSRSTSTRRRSTRWRFSSTAARRAPLAIIFITVGTRRRSRAQVTLR